MNKAIFQAEKERKIAEFQLKVKERLRAMKVREQKDMVDRTLQLTESENLLMKSVDPVKKPPIVASPLVAINSQVKVCLLSLNRYFPISFCKFFWAISNLSI